MSDKPDCMTCGACCVSLVDQDAYADVTVADVRRLGSSWASVNVVADSPFDVAVERLRGKDYAGAIRARWRVQRAGPLRGCETCACVALRGSVMHRVSCAVYERRPQSCRVAVVPGDRTCVQLRRLVMDAIEDAAR